MFSLVIVIISILLVSALALVVMYYGGSSLNEGASKAEAVKIMNQGNQIMGAADLYKSDTGSWPPSLEVLVSDRYLKTIPVGAGGNVWMMPKAGSPTFILQGVQVEPCKSVNNLTHKTDGIFDKLSSTYTAQCYAPATDIFNVVFTKDGKDLTENGTCPAGTTVSGLPGLGAVICTPVPESCDDPGWVKKPTKCSPTTPTLPENPNPPGTPGSGLVASPTSINFDDTPLGVGADAKVVRVYNTGVNPEQMYYTTNNSEEFDFYSECDSGILNPGESCDIFFYFTPAVAGVRTDSAALGTEGNSLSIGMAGRGVVEAAAAAPLAIEYLGTNYATTTKNGQTLAGSPTLRVKDTYDYFDHMTPTRPLNTRTFLLKNTGTETINISGVTLPNFVEGDVTAKYTVNNGCGNTLPSGGSCNITVQVQGEYTGYVSGEGNLFQGSYQLAMPLTISYFVGVAKVDSYSGKVNAIIQWMPEFTLSDGQYDYSWFDFGFQAPNDVVGSTIKKMLVVTNNSSADIPVSFDTVRGHMNVMPSAGCSGKAPAGKKCFYEFSYKRIILDITPLWVNPQHVEGVVDLQIAGRTGQVYFISTTTALSLTPMTTDWGPQPIGGTMSKTYTVRNNAKVGIPIKYVKWSLDNSYPNHQLTISNNSCTGTLAPGATCKFTANNTPTGFPSGYTAGRVLEWYLEVGVDGWEKGYTTSNSPDDITVRWSLVSGGQGTDSTDTDSQARAQNFVQQGGPNLFEVPVTVLPYTNGCSGDATAFNTCASGRLAQALGMTCNVFKVETSWSIPDTYQSRISCRK